MRKSVWFLAIILMVVAGVCEAVAAPTVVPATYGWHQHVTASPEIGIQYESTHEYSDKSLAVLEIESDFAEHAGLVCLHTDGWTFLSFRFTAPVDDGEGGLIVQAFCTVQNYRLEVVELPSIVYHVYPICGALSFSAELDSNGEAICRVDRPREANAARGCLLASYVYLALGDVVVSALPDEVEHPLLRDWLDIKYNSALLRADTFGVGWSGYATTRVSGNYVQNTNYVFVRRPAGRIVTFQNVNGLYQPPVGVRAELKATFNELDEWAGWKYQSSDSKAEFYDTDGRLQSVSYASGYFEKVNYDAKALIQSVEDSLGMSIEFQYRASGEVELARSSDGRQWEYRYDDSGNLISIKSPDTSIRTYHYGEAQFISSPSQVSVLTGITNASGSRELSVQYNNVGQARAVWKGVGAGFISVSYDPTRNVAVAENGAGQRTYWFQEQKGIALTNKIIGNCNCGS